MRGVVVSAAGWVVTLIGVVLFPLPGPGLLLIAVGLWLLATQHDWAARRVDRVRLQALHGAARGVATVPRACWSVVLSLALAASGLLWLWVPAPPGWWSASLPDWLWLPGGTWSGVGQIVSGLITLGVLGYAWVRFHGRPEELAEIQERLRALDPV
ncbi:MAG: PGPGW domain-containing protein [Nocardioides sp.]|nr:PGPGW domain-containing protein [Nocardioides sp.]